MDKLDGKWLIKSITDTEMELIDDSSPEEIRFSRADEARILQERSWCDQTILQ